MKEDRARRLLAECLAVMRPTSLASAYSEIDTFGVSPAELADMLDFMAVEMRCGRMITREDDFFSVMEFARNLDRRSGQIQ